MIKRSIHSKPRQFLPDDPVRVMVGEHVDSTGRHWPSGTHFVPLSSVDTHTQDVTIISETVKIEGETVRFERRIRDDTPKAVDYPA
jgi:hypothetical protein